MRTSEQIQAEIEAYFGFVPPFFAPAQETPQVLENLWQQTLWAYVNNPLPHLFKEKLAAYLSRYCGVPYCMLCHSCSLRPLGVKAWEVLKLLEAPTPTVTDIELQLSTLAAQIGPLIVWSPNSVLEECLLHCSTFIFLEPTRATHCHQELRRVLGPVNYQHLVMFLSYMKVCHSWMEAHPEITYEADMRVQNHLDALLEDEPRLAEFFRHYRERVRCERQNRESQLLVELAERKRNEEEARLLQSLTQAISESPDFHSSLAVTLRRICEVAGWNFGEAWVPRPDGAALQCSPAWYTTHPELEKFRRLSEGFEFSLSIGLPGRVWASKQIEWAQDVSVMPETTYLRTQTARDCGLRTGLGIPLIANEQVLAVLIFYMFESHEEDKQVVELISALTQLGSVIQQKRTEVEMRRLNAELEQRVIERTAQLAAANQLLEGQNCVLEMVAKGVALPDVLKVLTQLIEEQSSQALCSSSSHDGKLVEISTHLAGIAIEREQAAQQREQLLANEQAARIEAQASEERYRFLAESIPQIVWVARPDSAVEYYNQQWFDYTGLTPEECYGNDWESIRDLVFHPDDVQPSLNRWLKSVSTGELYEAEYRLKRSIDGAYRWHLNRASPMHDSNGQIFKWVGTCTDIHDRKQAEQLQGFLAMLDEQLRSLEEPEEVLWAVLTSVGEFFQVSRCNYAEWDLEHDCVYVYPDYCRGVDSITGTYPISAFGPDITELKQGLTVISRDVTTDERTAEHWEAVYQKFAVRAYVTVPLIKNGQCISNFTVQVVGQGRDWTETEVKLLETVAERTWLVVANARLSNETRKALERERQARAEAETANRLKDEFLATVSHELRTPLNAMLGWIQMLRRGSLNEATVARALETIERNARSQNQLINDLLDVSRIVSGKLRLNVGPIKLTSVIDAAIDSVRFAAEAKAIRLTSWLDSEAGPIMGDSERLQQVVWNLLSNALKFTPSGGCVEVRLRCVESHIEITVSDTGCGIHTQFLPYVFERFRQADSTTTRSHGGLGLGLAIVRQLVELHGGTVAVASPGEGQGATFTVHLPLMTVHK